jgi:hypothetical protein
MGEYFLPPRILQFFLTCFSKARYVLCRSSRTFTSVPGDGCTYASHRPKATHPEPDCPRIRFAICIPPVHPIGSVICILLVPQILPKPHAMLTLEHSLEPLSGRSAFRLVPGRVGEALFHSQDSGRERTADNIARPLAEAWLQQSPAQHPHYLRLRGS